MNMFNKLKLRSFCLFLCLAFINLSINGCGMRTYIVKKHKAKDLSTSDYKEAVDNINIFLHCQGKVYELSNPIYSEQNAILQGALREVEVNKEQLAKDLKIYRRGYGYYNLGNALHLYAEKLQIKDLSEVNIPLKNVTRVEIYEPERFKNAFGYTMLGVGVAGGALLVAVIALLLSSCPYVYTLDADGRHFAGEAYPGAIYKNIERDDYLMLPMAKVEDDKLRLLVSNELREIQYTNLAELIAVGHSEHVKIAVDRYGRILTFGEAMKPISAETFTGVNIQKFVNENDTLHYDFNELGNVSEKGSRSITLAFNKPEKATKAKLLVKAKNSLWLETVYGKFTESFGRYYPQWQEKQRVAHAEPALKWKSEQELPLKVELKTKAGWQHVDDFELAGPMSERELAMAVDVSDLEGKELQLRLSTGFWFWELNSVSIDYSDDAKYTVKKLSPETAIDQNAVNQVFVLSGSDQNYLVQNKGQATELVYNVADTKVKTTFILHSRGYYEHQRDFKEPAQWGKLLSFKRKGALPMLSEQLFMQSLSVKEEQEQPVVNSK